MTKKAVIIGLTGQSGSGKSTVSDVFKSKGFQVVDADMVARELVSPQSGCLQEIEKNFGNDILNEDRSLNRKKLGDIVFNNKKKLILLNSIMYPAIIEEINRRIARFCSEGAKFIVLDAPTLFESGADAICDVIISVIAPEEMRVKRIINRDKITQEQARSRLSSQHHDDFYKSRSDYIITNDGEITAVEKQTKRIINQISS
ncbi:MAG: dephospho-CoA kinase [Oscillospiraceae bacterium]|jgi:dephospho-CoA kinase|nr:dephospho-CoA kinase [Oscillospiraceae bacterium]